jgi:hypothetical protein
LNEGRRPSNYGRRKSFLRIMAIVVTITIMTIVVAIAATTTALSSVCYALTPNEVTSQVYNDNNNNITSVGGHFNSTGNSSLLIFENPDLGIKIRYPSNWIKQEDYLLLHTIAAFVLVHTDTHDRTNTTLAEFDIRIYGVPQNEASTNQSMIHINTTNEVVLNSYRPSSGMLVMRVLNTIYHSEELQTWIQVPAKHLLFEIAYISDPQSYLKYLSAAKKMMNSFEIANRYVINS